jgi:hypothetical protein
LPYPANRKSKFLVTMNTLKNHIQVGNTPKSTAISQPAFSNVTSA